MGYLGSSMMKLSDFSGGINVHDAPTSVNDNQATVSTNMTVEGNKLISSPGFKKRFKVGSTDKPVQGLHINADGDIFTIQDNVLYKNGERTYSDSVYVQNVGDYGSAYTATINSTAFSVSPGYAITQRYRASNGVATLVFADPTDYVAGETVVVTNVGGTGYNGKFTIISTGVLKKEITYQSGTSSYEAPTADTNGRVGASERMVLDALKAAYDASPLTGVDTRIESFGTYIKATSAERILMITSGSPVTLSLAVTFSGSPTYSGSMLAYFSGDSSITTISDTARYNIDSNSDYVAFVAESGSLPVAMKDGIIISIAGFTGTEATCLAFYQGMMFIGIKNAVYNSKVADDTNPWKVLDFSGAPANSRLVGNSSKVVGFAQNNEKFYIGKFRDTVHTFTDSSINTTTKLVDLPIRQLTSNGPVNQQCFIPVQQDVFYFDGVKVRRLSYEQNTLALKDVAISTPIQPLIDGLPKDQSKATSQFTYPYYNLYLRSDGEGDTENGFCLKYQVEHTSWTVDEGKTVGVAAGSPIASVAGSTFDGTVWDMDTTYSFDGNPIPAKYRSKWFDSGDSVGNKRYYQIQLDGVIGADDSAILDVYVGNSDIPKYSWEFTSNGFSKLDAVAGTSVVGATTLGSDGPSTARKNFSHRFTMYADGPNISWGLRYSDYTYVEVHSGNITLKKLRTGNFRIHQ